MSDEKSISSQSTNPAVSVIIPMYNASEYIGECLDSLLGQTFQDFEVIVVDDCSTDNSVEVVEEYTPKFNGRLRLTKTETNSGGGGYVPRNVGLKLARGEYVSFVDADDFILLTALETLYTAAKEYDTEVVYAANHYRLDEPNDAYVYRDRESNKFFKEGKEDNSISLIVDDSKYLLDRIIMGDDFSAPWSRLIRRDFLLKNNIFFPDVDKLSNGGDFLWCIHLYACTKKYLRLPTTIYFYRRYNSSSVTFIKRHPQEQVSNWFVGFITWLKVLNELANKFEILRENPSCILTATKNHFNWCLRRTLEARNELTNQDIYEVLRHNLSNQRDLPDFVLPFLFSVVDFNEKLSNKRLQTVDKLKKELDQLIKNPLSLSNATSVFVSEKVTGNPAISVVIPLYNGEKYVSECLDSLLAQTFQDFEVIIVDDCSTDNSVEIVESYMPKFNNKLKLYRLENNSGSGGVPRTKGIIFSCGEYIQFLDADDMLTSVALAEMYSLAKEYDTDVVYSEKYYMADEYGANIKLCSIEGASVDKPTFEPQDLKERLDKNLKIPFNTVPWLKFVRRDVVIKNEIFFPQVYPSEDTIWTYGLFFYAEKILRVPNAVYIYRQCDGSMMRKSRTPQQMINFWLNAVFFGIKSLNNLLCRHEFFKENPALLYDLLHFYLNKRFNLTLKHTEGLTEDEVYSTIKDKFGDKLDEYDVLISTLCTTLYNEKRQNKVFDKFKNFLTARIDIKLFAIEGDFQILSISDKKANVIKPEWFQKSGVGYVITSWNGELILHVKAITNGRVNLSLKGPYVRDPKSKSERIPYWIDYTKLIVNEKTVFDKITPAWHDKPYHYNLEVKAGEEIQIQLEWLPHRSDTIDESKFKTSKITALESKVATPLPPKVTAPESKIKTPTTPKPKPKVAKLPPLYKPESLVPRKFNPLITARIDAKFMSTTGDFQILSISDDKAKITKPNWFQRTGIGYVVQSAYGELIFIAKATADGQITLNLRGMEIRNPGDWAKGIAKRIPYWIDYTKLTVNGKKIFNTRTPAWCDEPYKYSIDVEANEEIIVEIEWQPHNDT